MRASMENQAWVWMTLITRSAAAWRPLMVPAHGRVHPHFLTSC
jgi:hypothetical protein